MRMTSAPLIKVPLSGSWPKPGSLVMVGGREWADGVDGLGEGSACHALVLMTMMMLLSERV